MTWPYRRVAVAAFLIAFAPLVNAQATLASAKPPGYPLGAKAAGIDGPVVLKGTISKEGKLQSLRVVSGAPELRQAAIDAVSNWTYQPYKHFGRVVEVHTTITVNFDMGKGQKKLDEQTKARAELEKSAQPTPSQESATPPAPKQ